MISAMREVLPFIRVKINNTETFRLCALGAIDETDIEDFFEIFEEGLKQMGVSLPVYYRNEERIFKIC